MEFTPTIGLEIHAELKTRTKMFCNSKNDPDEATPNTHVCPVCMAHPGTLPVPNKEAVQHVLRVGVALEGKIAEYTEFDRKNYFYPDIPKGYQISQYKYPLVEGGTLKGFSVTRVHLEEDTARSTHDKGDYSLVDYNRAGVPLMELVTEPVIHSGEEAISFARELQLLLRELGASDANMEKGQMRVEANISVGRDGVFGTKVEVKNLNSFRSVGRAIDYEIKRQTELLSKGGSVNQETRGWDEAKQVTFSQRAKEDSHDYRYFPDPDLPKLFISHIPGFTKEDLKKTMPETPWERRGRYIALGMKEQEAAMFLEDLTLRALLEEEVLSKLGSDQKSLKLALNYLTSDLAGLLKKDGYSIENVKGGFVSLIQMISEGSVGSRGAKDLLEMLAREGGEPRALAEKHGLLQQRDEEALKAIVSEVIASNEKAVAEYKAGKTASVQFLIGQVMRASKGSADPKVAESLIIKILG